MAFRALADTIEISVTFYPPLLYMHAFVSETSPLNATSSVDEPADMCVHTALSTFAQDSR